MRCTLALRCRSVLKWNWEHFTHKKRLSHQILGDAHLVGLVDVVAVQGAEQMRQTGHVVIVYGVDDSLHHEGVLLILDSWRRPLFPPNVLIHTKTDFSFAFVVKGQNISRHFLFPLCDT